MIDLVLLKKDMLLYVQDVKAVSGMGRGLSDHLVVLCKVRLVDAWIKRREAVNRARRVRREKLREHQYLEGYDRCMESKRVKWDEGGNVEQMWEQLKRSMDDSAREVSGSVRGAGGKESQKCMAE